MTESFPVPAPEWTQALSPHALQLPLTLVISWHSRLSWLRVSGEGSSHYRNCPVQIHVVVTLPWKSPLAFAPRDIFHSVPVYVSSCYAPAVFSSKSLIPTKPLRGGNSVYYHLPSTHIKASPSHTKCPSKIFLNKTFPLNGTPHLLNSFPPLPPQ